MANLFDFAEEKRNRISVSNGSLFTLSFENEVNEPYNPPKEDIMNGVDMTREELDAKLAQNKAEMQAIASGMREEMAHWREEQNAQIGKIITTLSVLDVKLDERYENQKTASTRTQWMIGIAIAVAAIIPAVIALLK